MKYIIAILLIYIYIDRRPIRLARRNKRKDKKCGGYDPFWNIFGF